MVLGVCVYTLGCMGTGVCACVCILKRECWERVSLEVRPLLYYLREFPQQACRGSSTANRVCGRKAMHKFLAHAHGFIWWLRQ